MLIYVPYAMFISLQNRYTSIRPFDSAAGEVAYLAVSMTLWLATAMWICTFLNTSDHCMDWTKGGDEWIGSECYTHAATAALGFLHATISAIWLAMLVWLAHRTGMPRHEAFKMSVNVLLRGGHSMYAGKGPVYASYDPDATELPPLPPRPQPRPYYTASIESPPYQFEDGSPSSPSLPTASSPSKRDLPRKEPPRLDTEDKSKHQDLSDLKTEIISPTFERKKRGAKV